MQKLQMQKLLTFFFSKNICIYDQSFNDTLTNDIVSFEQLGPEEFNWLDDNNYFAELHITPSDEEIISQAM